MSSVERIICPFHKERTPSCVIYNTGRYYCFGCGAKGKAKDLGYDIQEKAQGPSQENIDKLNAEYEVIQNLPTKNIRGLTLPYDDIYYYIVWPNTKYYKKRLLDTSDNSKKYKCPTGVPQPLLHAHSINSKNVVIVEGELNALSLAEAQPKFDIVSPGGTSSFSKNYHLQAYTKYDNIKIVVDKDTAGILAIIDMKTKLRRYVKNISYELVEIDYNDELQKYGLEKIKKIAERLERSFR